MKKKRTIKLTENQLEMIVKKVMNESVTEEIIEITKIEPDEKSNKKQTNNYHVNYQITVDGELIEIEGTLKPYNSGRSEEFTFEPGYFTDKKSETYYDDNWENIQDNILNKFNKEF